LELSSLAQISKDFILFPRNFSTSLDFSCTTPFTRHSFYLISDMAEQGSPAPWRLIAWIKRNSICWIDLCFLLHSYPIRLRLWSYGLTLRLREKLSLRVKLFFTPPLSVHLHNYTQDNINSCINLTPLAL
jgi:hypothetical protein